MTIARSVIFNILEEAGREETGGREELTIREVFEAYGGAGSGATRRLAGELGVSQRQVQRYVTEAQQRRGIGPKGMRFFREMSTRELRRAGARALRDRSLTLDEGSEFALCYGGEQQGDEREIRGDAATIEDNNVWIDHFENGDRAEVRHDSGTAEREYNAMARAFTDAMLEAYGVPAGELDVCDEDGGQNLSFTAH